MSSSVGTTLDLRAWMDTVKRLDRIQEIEGAHWDREIGALSEANYRNAQPAALLFKDIRDDATGIRVLSGTMSNARRLGMTLRLGDDLDDHALVQALRGKPNAWLADYSQFVPNTVADGPVLEVVERDDEVDLTAIPVPLWHEDDGGRYIGTGSAVFTCNLAGDVVNAGAYRIQIQGRNEVTINIEAGKHGAMHLREWFEKEGRAPIAASLGHDPLLSMIAGTEIPRDVSELEYAGAVLGAPVDVIKGEVTGLPLPADSEFIIEGWMYPDRRAVEGPFGEWTGYYSGGVNTVPIMEVTRVYRRSDAILLGMPPGKPPHDYSYMRSVMKSAMILDALVATGLPGVEGVWAHEEGGGRQLIAVGIDQKYQGHAKQAGLLASQLPAAAYMNKFVIVVDADVDTRSLSEVVWAMCTRTDPGIDIEISRRTWGSRVDPLAIEGELPFNTRAVIDACRPYERLKDFSKVAEASDELIKAVLDKWPSVKGN